DQVAFAVPAVGALLVVAVAEVVVAGVGVGEQVPDDGEDRVADRDDRASFPATPGEPVVALAEEGVGPGGCGDDLAEGGGEPGVALAGGAALGLAGGAAVDGGELGPGDQVPGGREAAHVDADLRDQLLGGGDPDAGDLIQLLHRAGVGSDLLFDPGGHL